MKIKQLGVIFPILLCMFMVLENTRLYSQESFQLAYKYRQGEKLIYKTERHDSTTMNMMGENKVMEITTWSLNSLTILNTPPGQLYEITSAVDSSWNNMDKNKILGGKQLSGSKVKTMSISNGSKRKMTRTISMTQFGKTEKGKAIDSNFIIPLPEKPLKINESWTFEYTVKLTGRAKGEKKVKGNCLLYSVEDNIATIILNSKLNSQTEMNLKMGDKEISINSSSAESGMSLIYFDIAMGKIIEIVTETSIERTTETPMGGGGVNTTTSKLTIKLQ